MPINSTKIHTLLKTVSAVNLGWLGPTTKENEKNADLYYLEASQSKAGAESHRLYDSSREVVSVWKYKYIPEMIEKKPQKTKPKN